MENQQARQHGGKHLPIQRAEYFDKQNNSAGIPSVPAAGNQSGDIPNKSRSYPQFLPMRRESKYQTIKNNNP
jgi:hypothetical protein